MLGAALARHRVRSRLFPRADDFPLTQSRPVAVAVAVAPSRFAFGCRACHRRRKRDLLRPSVFVDAVAPQRTQPDQRRTADLPEHGPAPVHLRDHTASVAEPRGRSGPRLRLAARGTRDERGARDLAHDEDPGPASERWRSRRGERGDRPTRDREAWVLFRRRRGRDARCSRAHRATEAMVQHRHGRLPPRTGPRCGRSAGSGDAGVYHGLAVGSGHIPHSTRGLAKSPCPSRRRSCS